ncbi:MAG: SUF system Fe-S cluster assembly regulator [Kordiimonas sp.]|nr:SUF system Fe-S cluster assembly regulator [Kordiimonas sp.]
MKLSNMADYAVVLMTHIAIRPETVHSAADLADETHIPLPTVSKVLGAMVRGQLLMSHRGTRGGFTLAQDRASVTVSDIIQVVDGPVALTNCLEDGVGECGLESGCHARQHWNKINTAVEDALNSVSLADLVPSVPDFFAASQKAEGKESQPF